MPSLAVGTGFEVCWPTSLIPVTAICETGSINVLKHWRFAEPWYRSQKAIMSAIQPFQNWNNGVKTST
jgi:hypothetical protein